MSGGNGGDVDVISRCLPGANIWIQSWFNECIYTPWDMVAFAVGLSSVCFWVVAQVPQFISNCSRQSADGLSPWFLVQWLAGDSFNLLGCLLTGDQLATETITAGYFIFADCVILSQYLYYGFKGRKLAAYGSDSDESLHKPTNGYYEAIQSGAATQLGKLLEESAMKTDAEVTHPQLYVMKHQATKPAVTNSEKAIDCGKHMSVANLADSFAENRSKLRCCFCSTSRVDHSRMNAVFSSGLFVLQKHQQDCCFANDLRTHLQRVIGCYGLEYNIPLVRKVSRKHVLSSGKHCEHAGLHARKYRAKFAFCFTGLLILGSFSWQSFLCAPIFEGNSIPNGKQFVVLGRRSLKELREENQAFSQRTLQALSSSASLWTKDIGLLFGWASSVLYLSSRVSQVLKNSSRKSAEGLSLGMIGCAVMANLTYGVAILMLIKSWGDLFGKLPWILGSLGTVSLDLFILIQAYYFSCLYGKITNDSAPLLA
uniref:PQ-loop repeat family protein / transmembrane family protein n=1 Tax=Araucaria cunninghamii TaxID=56994 RepID=A0A0D6R0G8_ARACU